MGFLDKAKKLAEQAKGLAEGALSEMQNRNDEHAAPGAANASPAQNGASQFGTPYVEGMLGRPGWRAHDLADPAAVLPIKARDNVGIPHSTKSEIVEEPFGMGRRWTSGGKSAGLFYRLHPDHAAWEPPAGRTALADVPGATVAALDDGRSLVFIGDAVLEVSGLDDDGRSALATVVAAHL